MFNEEDLPDTVIVIDEKAVDKMLKIVGVIFTAFFFVTLISKII